MSDFFSRFEPGRDCIGDARVTGCSKSSTSDIYPEFRATLAQECDTLLQDQLNNLLLRIPKRSTDCITAHGKPIATNFHTNRVSYFF